MTPNKTPYIDNARVYITTDHVERAVVAGHDVIARGEEAQHSQPVVDHDHDDVMRPRQQRAVGLRLVAVRPPAAVDPHHDLRYRTTLNIFAYKAE